MCMCTCVCVCVCVCTQVVGDSTPPPLIRSRGGNRPFRLALLKDVIAGLIEV